MNTADLLIYFFQYTNNTQFFLTLGNHKTFETVRCENLLRFRKIILYIFKMISAWRTLQIYSIMQMIINMLTWDGYNTFRAYIKHIAAHWIFNLKTFQSRLDCAYVPAVSNGEGNGDGRESKCASN